MNYPNLPDLSLIKPENAIVAMHRLVTEVRYAKYAIKMMSLKKYKIIFRNRIKLHLFALVLSRMWPWRLRHIQTLAVTLKKYSLWVETTTVSMTYLCN